jgi:hypothetical protein
MDTSIEYAPLYWQQEDGLWYLVRDQYGRTCRIYGPFDEAEAKHAAWVWGVEFVEQEAAQ